MVIMTFFSLYGVLAKNDEWGFVTKQQLQSALPCFIWKL